MPLISFQGHSCSQPYFFLFFFNDTATTEIYTLSLHDALPIWPKHTQAAFQPVSAGESQDRIDAIGRKTTRVIVDIGALAVDCGMRTHLPHQFHPFLARCSRKHPGAAKPCELHRERSDAARGAVNDDGLTLLEAECVVNAL